MIDAYLAFFRQVLRTADKVTLEYVGEVVEKSPFALSSEEKASIARILMFEFDVSQGTGSTIKEKFDEWYPERKKSIDFYYWARLERFLRQTGKMPSRVVGTLDQVTDEIVGLAENPLKEGNWRRRGMVIGQVQSGKTANYTALISKAADAGYKVIILVAGITNSLRRQTQERIDEQFIGRDSAGYLTQKRETRRIGVSEFSQGDVAPRHPVCFTSTASDFKESTLKILGLSFAAIKEPLVLVLKKNSSTLGSLLTYLEGEYAGAKIPDPMLFIDDEADNASINTAKNAGGTTTINRLIRKILNRFARTSYIGYTATPFANIFIDPAETGDELLGDDIFPADFIKYLDPPSNYVSASRVFGERAGDEAEPSLPGDNSIDMVRPIDDYEPHIPLKHKKTLEIEELPKSLETAILEFILVRAIRVGRGQETEHCSMMINVSRFNDVQERVSEHVSVFLDQIRNAIALNAGLGEAGLANVHLKALKDVWRKEYSIAAPDWSAVQRNLIAGVATIVSPALVNMKSGELDYRKYKDGLHVIAIGGLALSRGLTLEGLSISYLLRNSRAYDTIMQMGRWFGYRPGYEDLCRLHLPRESADWYAHIAHVLTELRAEIRHMEAAEQTPSEFGLKVRTHPDTLEITARNKMRDGKQLTWQTSYARSHVEGFAIHANDAINSANRKLTADFLAGLSSRASRQGVFTREFPFWHGIPVDRIRPFIAGFRLHPHQKDFVPVLGAGRSLVEEYIAKLVGHGELLQWDVVVPMLEKGGKPDPELLKDTVVRCRSRTGRYSGNGSAWMINGSKQRVADRADAKLGLTDDEFSKAEINGKTDASYNLVRVRPLLIVHDLDMPDLTGIERPITFSICFPDSRMPHPEIEYVANRVLQSQLELFDPDVDADDELETELGHG